MAILGVQELPDTGVQTGDDGVNTATRRWLITTDLNDTANEAILGIPVQRGDDYPDETSDMTARACTCKRHPDDLSLGIFIAEVNYSSKNDESDKTDGSQDTDEPPEKQDESIEATDRPMQIKYSSVAVECVMVQTTDDTPKDIVNSVQEQFDPPVTIEVFETVIHITMNKPFVSINQPAQMKQLFDGTVNDGLFLGYPARTLRVNQYNWTSKYERGVWFWEVELEIQRRNKNINGGFWTPVNVANIGRRELVYNSMTGLTWKPIKVQGEPMALPLSITPDGSGQILRLTPGAALQYLQYNVYYVVNWTGLTSYGPPII